MTYQLITWTESRTGLTGSEAMDLLEGHAGGSAILIDERTGVLRVGIGDDVDALIERARAAGQSGMGGRR